MQDFEQLGLFYLGRRYDLAKRASVDELVLYDSRDLTTHAVCVGMTGSGKTGLCLTLLEEAAIDGVPAIAIDPKGDLGNLLLTFPELRPADFEPWLDPSEAKRQGMSEAALAEKTATKWREGLASWGQEPARIAKLREAVDMAIYTPGSTAGLPLAVLRSLAAPPKAIREDAEALRERVSASVAGLLALAGVDADPIQSRPHILLSQLLERAWSAGRDLDMAGLIREIQKPPIDRVGVVDIESFFPTKDRTELAMRLNNLLASPSFAAWIEGEPLDVGRLLHTAEGKPRLSIISIAHLSDAERMFFVTILLGEVLSWIRTQPGTSSLRAILYMDEIFGFFPPTANPPSKPPMLTLLKQARAYGLGIVLATQNPVDLDYKGLSNTGTWFLGRLQTERDKARVLEGLEGASAAAGGAFDRGQMEATLAGLGNRVFLMNNVHEDQPVVFETRWCMSYLRGPLTRGQIQTLMAPAKQTLAAQPKSTTQPAADPQAALEAASPNGVVRATAGSDRPVLPAEAGECFMPQTGTQVAYRPALVGAARLRFVDAKLKLDTWQELTVIAPIDDTTDEAVWERAVPLQEGHRQFAGEGVAGATFAPLPSAALRAKSYAAWQKALAAHLYRSQTLPLWQAPRLKLVSQPGESEADFRLRVRQLEREERDRAVDELRQEFADKHATLEDKIRKAQQRIEREKSQFQGQAMQTVVSIGSSILGALFGRKLASATNMRRAGSAANSANRAAKQRGDVGRAEDDLTSLIAKRDELDAELAAEVATLDRSMAQSEVVAYPVRPKKTDVAVDKVLLVWVPMGG